jgi:hypothetical protein
MEAFGTQKFSTAVSEETSSAVISVDAARKTKISTNTILLLKLTPTILGCFYD